MGPMAFLVVLAVSSPPSINANIFENLPTGFIMTYDPSAISQGMGGASAAVFWSAEPNYWANPALLGYYQGARWQSGSSRLSPELMPNVRLTSNRYTFAAYGIGVANSGRPVDAGNTHIDYGTVELDNGGDPILRFHSFDELQAWSAGVSLGRMIGSAATLIGREAPWILRYVDLAAGMTRKRTRQTTTSWDPTYGQTEFADNANSTDYGLLLRGGVDSDLLGWKGRLPVRADVALGVSRINADDVRFDFSGEPPVTVDRYGYATRVALGLPRSVHQRVRSRLKALALDGLEPMLSVGLAYDHELDSAAGRTFSNVATHHVGGEVAILNVLSMRLGYVSDESGGPQAVAWGFGVALPVGDVAGFRYDYGRYPLGGDLGTRSPWSLSAFVDPVALTRRLAAE